jgi:hypothetical protein
MLKDNGVTFPEYSNMVSNASTAAKPAEVRDRKKPYTKRRLAKAWRDGAALIERHGFSQGFYGNRDVGFCTLGAVRAAGSATGAGADPLAMTSFTWPLLTAITGKADIYPVAYNDAPGRTKEEVCRFMRTVAYTLEHGGTFPKWVQRIVESRKAAEATGVSS